MFGERVRELRHERGVSQEAFADLCGLHRTYMSGIERGLRNVSIENVVKIARTLEVPVGALFEWLASPETGTPRRVTRPPVSQGRPDSRTQQDQGRSKRARSSRPRRARPLPRGS